MKKTRIDKLLDKLNKHPVNVDKEFLICLIDLDNRLKEVENKQNNHLTMNKNRRNKGDNN